MHSFNVSHKEFQNFSEFYDAEILPKLLTRESKRKADVAKMWKRCLGLGLLLAAFLAFLAWRFPVPQLILFSGFFGIAGVVGYGNYVLRDIRSQTKDVIVSSVCRFIGWTFVEKVTQPPHLDLLQENGLLPKRYDRVSFEDKMFGKAHGADFEALECHMERENKSDKGPKYQTLFRGAIMALSFEREFLGRTVVLRDKGWFNRKEKAGMKRVGLVDPKFEKIFEAYGTDQVEARYLLTPTFMQRLVDLENSVDGKNIRFAFINGLLLIAVETPNRFEPGSMFKPLTETERTQKILDEVSAVYNIVDEIHRPRRDFN